MSFEKVTLRVETSAKVVEPKVQCFFETAYLSFKETEADKCIYVRSVERNPVFLVLFLNDGLIAARSQDVLESVIGHLSSTFKITLGDSSVFIGMQSNERNQLE